MVNHKATTIFLTLALLAQPIHAAREDASTPLKVVGIIGGLCLGAYAIGSCVNSWYTPSNESLIEKAQSAKESAQNRYGSLIHYLKSRNYELNEEHRSYIAKTYISESIQHYKQDMRDVLQRADKASQSLRDRMCSLERKGERCKCDYRTMEDCLSSLNSAESSLQRAYDYVDRHSGYFALHACVYEMQGVYAEVLSIVELYGHNRSSLAQYMRERIALNGINHRNSYPTIAYVESLNDRIRSLEYAIQHSDHSGDLQFQANTMLNKLSQVRSILLADDRYAYEAQERERARREEERLRIERERVAAEQRRAEAAERQNREIARQNDILREKNYIQREQNRLERDRNERHRYCDHYRCCCNQVTECPIFRIEVVH
jgi:hypothetical protein